MKKKLSEIAVTLFNLRDYCKTESDLAKTLELLKSIGYSVVQVSAVPLEPEVIRRQLDAFGMHCCATHEGMDFLLGDPSAVADKLDTLNCDFAALGMPPAPFFSHAGMLDLARRFNVQAEKLAARGKMIAYHNHCDEFDRARDKKILLETFFDNTSELVKSELDVQWVARGGANPVSWIRKLAGRIHVIHFKDFTIVGGTPVLCEVGEGNLEWPEIVKACRETKVRFFSVEQDMPFPGRPIFDSMKISYENLRALGLR